MTDPRADPPTIPFLGLNLIQLSVDEYLNALIARACNPGPAPLRIGYINAHHANLAFDSPRAAELFASLDWLYADGMAIVWAARWLGWTLPERINAGDFTLEFFRRAAERNLDVALVGGHPGDAEAFGNAFRSRLANEHGLAIDISYIRDGFFEGPEEMETSRAQLEAADPDIVLVAMGAPRQERLALEWSAQGRPRVWWCVGALFEYEGGRRRRAPVWMRRAGISGRPSRRTRAGTSMCSRA